MVMTQTKKKNFLILCHIKVCRYFSTELKKIKLNFSEPIKHYRDNFSDDDDNLSDDDDDLVVLPSRSEQL